jgi:hypothetical protein
VVCLGLATAAATAAGVSFVQGQAMTAGFDLYQVEIVLQLCLHAKAHCRAASVFDAAHFIERHTCGWFGCFVFNAKGEGPTVHSLCTACAGAVVWLRFRVAVLSTAAVCWQL